MKKEEILEGNKLLAEFMCLETKPMAKGMPEITYKCKNNEGFYDWVNEYMLKYNHSWDWLMPVVEKIESFEDEYRCAKFNVNIEQWFCEITDMKNSNEITYGYEDTKIESAFAACVDFAKWYKNQPK